MSAAPPFTVIVPAREEAAVLTRTAPALARALHGHDSQVVYVLNGRPDGGAEVIRAAFGKAATVIETERPGKARALTVGDHAADCSPRFYLDADVTVAPDVFAPLLEALGRGGAELVAPRLVCGASGGPLARRVAATWLSLPYARDARFQGLLGLSAVGRARWGDWPDLIADDRFAALMVPAERRCVVPEAVAEMPLPRSLVAWIGVRSRWLRGQRELTRLGLMPMREAGHGAALALAAQCPGRWPDLALYLAVRAAALPICAWSERAGAEWYRDHTTRRRPLADLGEQSDDARNEMEPAGRCPSHSLRGRPCPKSA